MYGTRFGLYLGRPEARQHKNIVSSFLYLYMWREIIDQMDLCRIRVKNCGSFTYMTN
jgi:hypothetical protein